MNAMHAAHYGYSQIRCTLKWHGHAKSAPDSLKQATFELAKKFDGRFNNKYTIWEFKTPEGQADELYVKMITFMENALISPSATPTPSQSSPPNSQRKKPLAHNEVASLAFQNEATEEVFKERAAILQYENNLSRAEAEKLAIKEILSEQMKG